MKSLDERVKSLENEIFIRHSITNPDLLIHRFEGIESFTEFDLDKQPVLNAYEIIMSDIVSRDFETIQDIKLVKLYSLTCNLIWYNNALKSYTGHQINFEPLMTLMKKKNRYFYLCQLKLHQTKFEFEKDIELLFKQVISSAYNSMIDSQDMASLDLGGDTPLIVKEHSFKVDEVNLQFKELSKQVNQHLKHKFSDESLQTFSNLTFII